MTAAPTGTPTSPLNTLISRIRQRKADKSHPYVLLLGKDCAKAAGKPLETAAESFIHLVQRTLPKWVATFNPLVVLGDGANPMDTVYQLIANLSRTQQNLLLRNLYAQIPVPLFYQDLARLIRLGYFTQIVTTNFDDLLEQALTGTFGMLPKTDFEVISVGDPDQMISVSTPPVSIIKLHGDLSQSNAVLTLTDIENLLNQRRQMVRQELAGDVILFGYAGESTPTEEFLKRTVKSELWWISENRTPTPSVLEAAQGRDFQIISGGPAAPAEFFALVYDGLQRAPARDTYRNFMAESASASESLPVPSPPDEQADMEQADLIEGQLRRAQRQLLELRRSSAPGHEEPALANQIEYQEREIARLEDLYRLASPNRKHVLTLVGTLWDSVSQSSAVDQDTKQFIQQHHDLLVNEFGQTTPNHNVIAASLSAMASMGTRLAASVVDKSVVRGLAEFAPSATWS